MELDPETCHRALATHDARFDGCFFVAVKTTKAYCRPVCRVKAPKRENCRFYRSAAEAEAAGYRPCLRCRPELAPGNASMDATARLARSAAILLEDGVIGEEGMGGIAERLGITARHLRRVFQAEFGVTPVSYAQTQRLLLAKRLLTDTGMPVTEVAFTAGFGSLRRFEALFQQRYRLTPRQLRKSPPRSRLEDVFRFELGFRPPYDWDALVRFLEARTIAGVEAIDDGSYRRVVLVMRNGAMNSGWVEAAPDLNRSVMHVSMAGTLGRVVGPVLSRIKTLFDLGCNPAQIGEVLATTSGVRVPGAFDGFETAVRAILGQQVSVTAARTLAGRLAAAWGEPVVTPFSDLRTSFPNAQKLTQVDAAALAGLGILPSRAKTIIEIARAVSEGRLELRPGVDVDRTVAQLREIKGVGEWTAQYIAMRALAWPDAFPHTDLGVMKALGERNPRRVLAAGESWRPWRAYAVMHLWREGSTNGLVH